MKVQLALGAALFIAVPLTRAAQQAAPAPSPSAPPGFEIPKDMTTYGDPAIAAGHMAIELHPAMLPSMATLVVKY